MIVPFGDDALLVTLGETIDEDLNLRVHALADQVRELSQRGSGLGMPVPAYASLLVPFDPRAIGPDAAIHALSSLVEASAASRQPERGPESPTVEIHVRYGGADGPDLLAVAELTGLTPAQVIDAHASTAYRVFMLGFAPGFAYMGLLPPHIAVPRRQSPRERVPAGSVAIADRQTAVYPSSTPGGWQLIGRTASIMWDARREPAALLRPGGQVRFVPISG